MGSLKGLDARKAAMVMGIMTLHAFSEGLGVGVSYGGKHGRRQVTAAATRHTPARHTLPADAPCRFLARRACLLRASAVSCLVCLRAAATTH